MKIIKLTVWEYPVNNNNECNNFLAKWIQLSLEQLTLAKN